MKKIYVINGSGGTGKDTICQMAAGLYSVRNISSITPVIEIAKFAGWDGEKTPESRRLLARLKEVFTEYNDLSFRYCMQQVQEFLQTEEQILFVHIREPEEIQRFQQAVGDMCETILVRRPSITKGMTYGNRADDGVEDYHYDHILYNDGDLARLQKTVETFLRRQK